MDTLVNQPQAKPLAFSKVSSFSLSRNSTQDSDSQIVHEKQQFKFSPYMLFLPFIFQMKEVCETKKIVQLTENVPKISKKVCNCKKSQCLKQYCDCFAVGQVCGEDCSCIGCFNQNEHSEIRTSAMEQILKRDPKAFTSKVEDVSTHIQRHKGCNCKKSGCQKKYCECYQAGFSCGELCKCTGCSNDHPHSFQLLQEIEKCIEPKLVKKQCISVFQ